MQKEEIKNFIETELNELGFELVELQLNVLKTKTIIRLFIDKLGEISSRCNVSVGELEKLSRSLQNVLEVKNIFNEANYVLEVSTPGLERKLNTINDFKRFKDLLVSVTLNENINELGEYFVGKLIDVKDNDSLVFNINLKEYNVDFIKIKKAKLKYEG